MESARPFHFKHFSLMHHRATMKVGTDAVLLAAWIDMPQAVHALDIGTGCGIIPLMLAQRFPDLLIDAIDLDEVSIEEAKENFSRSPWHHRLLAKCIDVRAYAASTTKRYDLIISNPPFFTSTFKTKHQRRNLARHTDTLNFSQLAQSAARLLKPSGRLALVLPADQFNAWDKAAQAEALFLNQLLEIVPVAGKAPNRLNMVYTFDKTDIHDVAVFTIREQDGRFTPAYNQRLHDFYLDLMD